MPGIIFDTVSPAIHYISGVYMKHNIILLAVFCFFLPFTHAQNTGTINDSSSIAKYDTSKAKALEKLWEPKVHDFLEYHTFGDSAPGLTNLGSYLVSGGTIKTSYKQVNTGRMIMNKANQIVPNGFWAPEDNIKEQESRKKILLYKDISERSYKYPDTYAMDNFNDAEKLLLKSIKKYPLYSNAYLNLATIYEENQTPGKGIPYLKQLIRLKPGQMNAHKLLGLMLYKTDNFDSSYSEFEKAIALMSPAEKNDFIFNSSRQFVAPYAEDKMDSISPDSLNTMIIKYWESRDPLYLTVLNERLLEQFARVTYSDLRFGVARLGIKGWESYRGVALLRYGFPFAIIRLRGEMNTDIWEYPDKTFYFTDEYMTGAFQFGIPEITKNWNRQNILTSQLIRQLPPVYIPSFEGPAIIIPHNMVQFKSIYKNNTDIYFNYALNLSDGWIKDGKFDLDHEAGIFFFDKYFEPVFTRRFIQHPIDYNNSIEVDSARYNVNSLYARSKPDSGKISFEIIRTLDNAVATDQKGYVVRNFDNRNLELSDIVLASDIQANNAKNYPITRQNITILPNPTGTFNKDHQIYLYYEVYNLSNTGQGTTDFNQDIILQKKEEKGLLGKIFSPVLKTVGLDNQQKQVSLTSNYQTKDRNSHVYLQLDMSNYEPGNYVLTIRIKDNISGKETEQNTELSWK